MIERLTLRNARYLSHAALEAYLRPGDIVCDATCGNGGDTEFLCTLVGDTGRVYAFDIQHAAIENTRSRLCDRGYLERAVLLPYGHETMSAHVTEMLHACVFNLGWLPGGDHTLTTRTKTTLMALEQAALLLRTGGLLSVCVYPGHEEGQAELEACRAWFSQLSVRQWTVLLHEFINARPETPRLFLAQKNP